MKTDPLEESLAKPSPFPVPGVLIGFPVTDAFLDALCAATGYVDGDKQAHANAALKEMVFLRVKEHEQLRGRKDADAAADEKINTLKGSLPV